VLTDREFKKKFPDGDYLKYLSWRRFGNKLRWRIKESHNSETEPQLISDQDVLMDSRGSVMNHQKLRQLYLDRRGKNTPEMSQGELIDDTLGDEY